MQLVEIFKHGVDPRCRGFEVANFEGNNPESDTSDDSFCRESMDRYVANSIEQVQEIYKT